MVAATSVAACASPVPKSFLSAARTPIVTAAPVAGLAPPSPHQRTLLLARQLVYRVRNAACFAVGSSFSVAGQLVTNRHVAAGTGRLELSTWSGDDFVGRVAGHSPRVDLARIAAEVPGGSRPAPLAASNPIPGEDVYVAGYPEGDQLTVTDGRLVGYVSGSVFGMDGTLLEVTARVKPGDSGSPVFSSDGHIVGVVFATETATGDGLAIPLDSLKTFLAGRLDDDTLGCAEDQPSARG